MPRKAPTHNPSKPRTPKHNPRGKDATNRQRRRAMHTGSKGWKLQRQRVLQRDQYTCNQCGHYGDQVDHIHGDAHEHVTDDRLQVLCLKCHSRKTASEIGAPATMLPTWMPIAEPGRLTLVCGPPAAGKSTYVREHAGTDDVVIDLDDIADRLGLDMEQQAHRSIAIRERNDIAADAIRAHRKVWVVAVAGTPAQRRYWKDRGAEVVILDPGVSECLARIEADRAAGRQRRKGVADVVARWH